MDFVASTDKQLLEMLRSIGIDSIADLFSDIPSNLRLERPLKKDGISEMEGIRHMESLSKENTFPHFESYLGAGAYDHYVPAIVSAICSKSEFLTAYTPYQPEISQGMLQAIFEFQSIICALTGLPASNASLYDGASACAEAALMTLRLKKKAKRILLSQGLHPHYRAVVQTYLACHRDVQIEEIPLAASGQIDTDQLEQMICDDVAGVIIQSPSYLGVMEDTPLIAELCHRHQALLVLSANPLSYGIFASAGELGADIAVGEGQPLGLPLAFGGPYLGIIACHEKLIRQLPGRITGQTVDTEGRPGYVLTLQAREQHIRREKATSNICSNQALAAMACLVATLWYGKSGIPALAKTNYQRTEYLKAGMSSLLGPDALLPSPTFNEFTVKLPKNTEGVLEAFREQGIEAGLSLNEDYPQYGNSLLINVTETKSKDQLDRYLSVARGVLS